MFFQIFLAGFMLNILSFLQFIHVLCRRLALELVDQEFSYLDNTSQHDIYFQLLIHNRFAFWEMLCLRCQSSVLATSGVCNFFPIAAETKPPCTPEQLILGPLTRNTPSLACSHQ